jgi:NitT/TauT family transport system substrate-binding protein
MTIDRLAKPLGTALLVLPVLLVACRRDDGGSTLGTPLQKITICQFAQVFVYLPLYVAIEKDFFKQEGLEVALINGGGDDKTFATVASGQAQFGVADPTFAAIAREKGQPGVVVASVVAGAPFWGVTKRFDLQPITDPAGLKDLRIATYPAPSTNYTLMTNTLDEHVAAVGNAQIIQGAFGTLLAMLDSGTADVAMELEPTVSISVKQGGRVVFSYPQMYGAFFLTGLYTTEEYRDAHPDVVQKAVNALERAMRFAHEDRPGTIDVARKVFPELDPEVAQNAVMRMLDEDTIPQHATLDREGWENAIRLRLDVGDLKSRTAADATFDPSFASRALEQVDREGT